MGLDMYLYARKYVSGVSFGKTAEGLAEISNYKSVAKAIGVSPDFVPENSFPHAYVSVCVLYWRKANAIHKWFVDNCQEGVDECQMSEVSEDNLKELRDLCRATLADKERASEVLPSQPGFFFGDTHYTEDYFQDLQDTIDGIDKILNDPTFEECDFQYRSSW